MRTSLELDVGKTFPFATDGVAREQGRRAGGVRRTEAQRERIAAGAGPCYVLM